MNKYGVGTIHPTNNSGDIEIIERLSNRIRKVKFLDTNSIKETVMSSIHSGNVKDLSLPDKYDVGTTHLTDDNETIEIIKYLSKKRRLIKFLSTNNVKNVNISSICDGKIKDPSVLDKYSVGTVHSTNNYGDIEIIEWLPNDRRKVKFLTTSNTKVVSTSNIFNRTVKDPSILDKHRVGTIHLTRNYGYVEVIKYLSSRRRLVRFLGSGYEKEVAVTSISSGEIKDTSIATVCNVGIFGTVDLTGKTLYKEARRRWTGIINRCYNTNSEYYSKYGGKGVTVSEDWKYFPNFYSWFVENYIEHCEIDKDLKQYGVKNKVYSADTCVFLPRRLNNSIKIGKGYRKKGNRYESYCFSKRGSIYIGLFDTKEEAFTAYLKTKIATIQKTMYDYPLTVDTIKAVNTFIDKLRYI